MYCQFITHVEVKKMYANCSTEARRGGIKVYCLRLLNGCEVV